MLKEDQEAVALEEVLDNQEAVAVLDNYENVALEEELEYHENEYNRGIADSI